jgi:hypothetical protein
MQVLPDLLRVRTQLCPTPSTGSQSSSFRLVRVVVVVVVVGGGGGVGVCNRSIVVLHPRRGLFSALCR